MSKQGFTLIEILIVIGMIAILAAAVIIAINPARQFAQARNTQRWSGVNSILNAVHQNMVDNHGQWTCDVDGDGTNDDIPSTATNMGSDTEGGDYDICDCLVPTYIATLPYDLNGGYYTDCADYDTGFTILEDANGRITVDAPSAELDATISVTR